MSFPRYPKYKPSGVEWLGDVPERWRVVQFKRLVKICNGKDYKNVEDANGLYPVIGSGGEFARASGYLFKGKSVLIGRKGTIDRPLYFDGPFWTVDTMFYTEITEHVDPKFVYYLALNFPFTFYSTNTALPSMTQEVLSANPVTFPPLQEQTAIAAFLDRETGKIDALVEEQRRLIELLKEKRQAVISHAVTKGLNPHAKMKPSGIDWLGDVPEHWNIAPLRFLAQFISGGTPDKKDASYWNGTIPWISSKDMKVDEIADAEDHITEDAVIASGLKIIPADHIVVVVRGMILAHSFPVAITLGDVTINQDLKALKCVPNLTPRFLQFVFEGITTHIVASADESAHGTKKLETEMLGQLPVLVPPVKEQTKIVADLRHKTKLLDDASNAAQAAIDLLQEHRTALISAAVTGKIDVRGVNHA